MVEASVYWGIEKLEDSPDREFRGAYLAVNEETNTLLDARTFPTTKNSISEYQNCIRESLKRLVPSVNVERLNIQDKKGVKPELEIGRLPYSTRDRCQELPIQMETSSRDHIVKGLANHTQDLNGCCKENPGRNTPLKAYVDASYRKGDATIGIAMYNAQARRLEFLESAQVDAETSVEAEFLAVKEACFRAGQLDRRIRLHTDCRPVKKRLHDEIPHSDISSTQNMYERHSVGTINVISRDENHFAHGLATEGYENELLYTAPYINMKFNGSPVLRDPEPAPEGAESKYGHML